MAATERAPVERALMRTTALVVALCIAVAGLALGGVAVSKTATVSQCINDNLGDRNAPSARDAAAHIKFAQALNAVLKAPTGPQQQTAFAAFERASDEYARTLQDDQKLRDQHPLGRC
jgi:CHASE1-domain containing sensor protein